MAEASSRYCSNCGHELGDEAQFCPNCGTAVHRAAHVPTPEADVPVSPPTQQAGQTPGYAPTEPPRRSTANRLLVGCVGLVVLGFLFVGCLAVLGSGGGSGGGGNVGAGDAGEGGAGNDQQAEGGNEETPKTKKYRVGQTATVGNVEWEVTDAFYTELLKGSFGSRKRGNFVVVDFTFTNNRNEEVTLDPELHMILKDSQGREFGTSQDAYEFMPMDLDIFLEPVNPGVSTDGRTIYQVAPDAKGFTLRLDDVEMMGDQSAVFDLGDISLRAYDPPASASATASAGAQ